MAQNTTVTLTAGVWTQLTNANATNIMWENREGYSILVKGTADATQPTDDLGAVEYPGRTGERSVVLADFFPGITAVRLWGYCNSDARVMVSHD
jgi:hypothetical protein